MMGDDIGAFVEFTVSECSILGDQRGLFRVFGGSLLKEPMQQRDRNIRESRGGKRLQFFLLILGQRKHIRYGTVPRGAQLL